MVVKLKVIGRTVWGETEYLDVENGRMVRYCWAMKLFYYADSDEYIFDAVEVDRA